MNVISEDQVKHIAELANLKVDREEKKFSEMLSDTLDYIDVLDELDTGAVEPTFSVGGLRNVYQTGDDQYATLSQEDAVANGSDIVKDLFATEAVLDRD